MKMNEKDRMILEKNEINELIDGILSAIRTHVVSIILYGSFARGDNTDGSDVDIAIILSDTLTETLSENLTDNIVDLDLKYDRVYSIIEIKHDDFERWRSYIPFYKNVDREGIVLWKAA